MHGDALIQACLRLSTANVSDALDRLGIEGAPHGIGPLWTGCPKIAGPAMTMCLVPAGPDSPITGTLQAIKAARPGDVMVIAHDGRMDVNSWGGIASFTAVRRGLAGVVIDGVTRDMDEMKVLGFPAYAKGVIQQSVRGRCAFGGHGLEVMIGSVRVRPGDLVVADDNGVVVVPQGRAEEVLVIARECLATEERIKKWIVEGVDPIEAHDRARYERMPCGEGKTGT